MAPETKRCLNVLIALCQSKLARAEIPALNETPLQEAFKRGKAYAIRDIIDLLQKTGEQ